MKARRVQWDGSLRTFKLQEREGAGEWQTVGHADRLRDAARWRGFEVDTIKEVRMGGR